MENKNNVSVRPGISVLSYFKKLQYTLNSAIAEFIDNSTQNFFDNEVLLQKINNNEGIDVKIIFDSSVKGDEKIIVEDNGLGMDIEEFKKAIITGKSEQSKNKNSRNEFGFGLKTSACWLGDLWSVETKKYGNNKKYSVQMNIEEIIKTNKEVVNIQEENYHEQAHFTRIVIRKLSQKPSTLTQRKKIAESLSNTYRGDIRKGLVNIYCIYLPLEGKRGFYYDFNDQEYSSLEMIPPLKFEEMPVFKEMDKYGNIIKEYRFDVDTSINFEDKDYKIKGFIGMLENGSYKKTGFALLRRGRLIKGGFEDQYKPRDIFKSANSFQSLRIFGELNLDDFPVTQTKTDFQWYNGLEDAFINEIMRVSDEDGIIRAARDVRLKTINTTNTLSESSKELLVRSISNSFETIVNNEELLGEFTYTEKPIIVNNISEVIFSDKKDVALYSIEREFTDKKRYKLDFYIDNDIKPESFLDWNIMEDSESFVHYEMRFHIDHVFFKPLSEDTKFISNFCQFLLGFGFSVMHANYKVGNNNVNINDFVQFINEFLKKES